MKSIKRKDEEGAMGIGTLIIFIAMVLVAAVAASVLINTANKLQQQAEKTGDQAIKEVSTSFVIKGIFAYNGVDGEVGNISLQVGLAAGAPSQSLNQTVIHVRTSSNERSLLAADQGYGPGANNYSWKKIIEQEGSFNQFLEQGDLVNITINIYEIFGEEIGTQEEVDIRLLPKHGAPTYEIATTPPVMVSKIVRLG